VISHNGPIWLSSGDQNLSPEIWAIRHLQSQRQLAGLTRFTRQLEDLRLSLGYRINEDLAWRSTLKLPTGDAAELTGSDAADLATGLYYSKRLWPRWIFHGSAGVVLLGEGDVLRQQQRDALLYGSATLSWQALRRTSFKLQLDLHSAAYDARPKPLGGDAGQLVAGVSFALGEGAVLDFTLSEDIVVGTSPDVVFQIGMRWRNP